jgi:farnesyl-diphosphate farnesyltransferase
MSELVGVAHAHLRNALSFTLLIPPEEVGIRRFCLWAVGLAVLTLRRIQDNPGFTSGSQVKVSRSAVAMTRVLTNACVRRNWMLRQLFQRAASGLPLAAPAMVRRPSRPALQARATVAEFSHVVRHSSLEGNARRSEGRSVH